MGYATTKQVVVGFISLLVLLAGFLLNGSVPALAQGTSGSLTGQITDPSGAAVVGATVTLKNVGTNYLQTATTDNTGIYLLKPVMPGNYSLTVTAKGFAMYVQNGIVITANLYATQDVRLKLASVVAETVTVNSDAEMVNTTSAELGATINATSISELPLDGRDPSSLVFLVPGAVDIQHHGGETIQTGFSFPTETGAGIGSGRNGSTFYMLDGVTNMDNYDLLTAPFPNADATQEFKVITSNYGAQYGFAPGAVVSIVTKSGSNQFHGGAFWYIRNNAMNATDWFSHQTDTLRRNQYGFFAGGPIKKDKLFVFGNYQGTKIIWNSTDSLTSTPTAAMLSGDFSGLASAADLASGTTDLNGPFKTINGKPNQLDTSLTTSACEYSASANCSTSVPVQLSTAAVNVATLGMIRSAVVKPNGTTLTPGIQLANGDMMYTYPTVHNSYDEGTAKLDYKLSPSQMLTLRSYINHFGSPSSDQPGNMESVYNHQSWTASFWQEMWYFNNMLQHTWTVSPTTVNTLSVFMNQMSAHSAAQELGSAGKPLCFSSMNIGVNELPGSCYMGALRINSNYGFESGWDEPSQEVRNTLGFTDTVNKALGKHSLTFGIDVMHQHAVEVTQYPTQPMIGFGRSGTGGSVSSFTGISCGASEVNCSPWGGFLADFLLGYASGYMQGAGEISDVTGWQVGPFVQDDWRIRPNLTVNLGLRWDPNTPPVPYNGRGAVFVPATSSSPYTLTATATSSVYPNAPAGLLFPGDPGVPNTLMNGDYGYWEPRLGLAWQPKQAPHTVIHAGFGMFTGPLQYSEYNHAADVAPFSPTYNFSGWAWNGNCGATACPDSVIQGAVIPFDAPWTSPFQNSYGGVSPFPSSPFPGTFAWASTTSKPPKNIAISTGQQISQVFARNYKQPRTYAWNLSIEHELTPTMVVRLAYVGNETDHLSALLDLNPQYPNSPSSKAYTNPHITRDADFADIYQDQSWATASYNALQIGFDRHMSHGLQLQSNLIWSHAIDITSSSNVSYGNPALGNPFSAKWNRGNSGADVPWSWISNFVYQAPFFREKGKLLEETIGGWQVSSIVTLQKGTPFSIGSWTDPGVGLWNTRADAAPGVPANMGSGSHRDWATTGYFNPKAFIDPVSCNDATPGWCGFGNTGRNAYWGPGVFGINASIMKNWTLVEGKTFQFRWDAFNVTNHPNFANPSSNVDSGSGFGKITGMNGSPRIFQGALRFTF
jgi:hypothetical protein